MNNDELLEWVRSEAIGFRDTKPFPEYEKVATQFDMVVDAIESLQARAKELESLVNKIYNGDCSLTTASIIAANFIPTEQPE